MRLKRPPHRTLVATVAALAVVAVLVAVLAASLRRAVDHLPSVAPETAAHQPRFRCNPGPTKPAPPQNPLPPVRPVRAPEDAYLLVDGRLAGPPIAGVGFNIEPTLWTCPTAIGPI